MSGAMMSEPAKISDAARDICARWFGMSPRDQVKSHPPHATLSKSRAAFDELIARGIISEEPYNHLGSVIFRGSEDAYALGRNRRNEIILGGEIAKAAASEATV